MSDGYSRVYALRRAWGDVSLKVAAGGLVGELLVVVEGLIDGSLNLQAAAAVAVATVAAYLKGDRVPHHALRVGKERR